MAMDKEINLIVGSGTHKGRVGLSAFLADRLSLSVSYKGERAATVVLTPEQVQQLRRALDEIAPQGESRGEEKLRLVA
jgi:hypothetical protein